MSEYELTCGIEIHQQLSTTKLFCSCPSELVEGEAPTFRRRLRPTASEMGETDHAALIESQKRLSFCYQAPPGVSCLVEADEEPPHTASEEAMDTVLTFATMLNASIVDEIQFMRKLVIDGSNTSGFQRTALIAMDGHLEFDGRRISIQSICLEEDAARKVEADDREVTYRIDRLGIPLIEIATGPDMHSPEEVRDVALRIGTMLRATKKVKRGIGTIREDINISIPGGARIEIKGVQDLRLLPLYVENEVKRQKMLLRIRDILKERAASEIQFEPVDISDLMSYSGSKLISSVLNSGGKVLAVPLPRFAGLLNGENGALRLGAELAGRARSCGVKGIFHSDELPAYGISAGELSSICERLSLADGDAFALCAAPEEKAAAALRMVVERVNEALHGVPEETRDPLPDGSTRYSRPLPGAARMYPETDVPPVAISKERLRRIRENLPELPEDIIRRLVSQYGINEQQAAQLVREGNEEFFERIAADLGLTSIVATVLTSMLPEMEREGCEISLLSEKKIYESLRRLSEGRFAKEALPELLRALCSHKDVDEAVNELGLGVVEPGEAEAIIRQLALERKDFVIERGMGAVGPLMGPVMEKLRGKVDGKEASRLLQSIVREIVEGE